MPFRDLNEDVLLQILPYCDVHTVLHVGRANKLLRALTLTKEIWLALIHDLAFRGILDLPPADVLRNYTVPDLVDDVKRIVLGPKTWSPASTSPPIITRQRALPAPWATDNSRQTFSGMRVLPGGKYIIWERHSSLLEIRSITRWECVWVYDSPTKVMWSIDVLDGGTAAVILLVCNTPVPFEVNIIRVKIIRVQLDTGEESGLFEQRLQIRHIWRPIILGNLFLVSVNSGRKDGVLLVNWRGRTHAALECVYDRNLEAILLPEHIIIVSMTAATRDRHIGVYAISSLLFANSFPSNVTDLVFSTGLQPLVSGSPLPDATEVGSLNLYAFKSPLRRGAHIVMLQICDLFTGLPRRGYRSTLFRLDPSATPGLLSASTTPVWKMLCSVFHRMSYQLLSPSAYFGQRGSVWDALPRRSAWDAVQVQDIDGFASTSMEPREVLSKSSHGFEIIHFPPSGGALVIQTDGTVSIVHFH